MNGLLSGPQEHKLTALYRLPARSICQQLNMSVLCRSQMNIRSSTGYGENATSGWKSHVLVFIY
jgi:hypothetical protein